MPVSEAKPLEVGEPSMTTKSGCVNFPFPSNLVIATPVWDSTTPGPGRSWPEMVERSCLLAKHSSTPLLAPGKPQQMSGKLLLPPVSLCRTRYSFSFPLGRSVSELCDLSRLVRGADCRNPA